MREELLKLEKLKYYDLCDYLKNKYGDVNGYYFVNEDCKSINHKIKRTSEGLFIHHIKECECIQLSQPLFAQMGPFEYQSGNNLVYCDYLEHFLLHFAIVKEFMTPTHVEKTGQAVGWGGLMNFIVPEIIDYINGYEYKREYMIKALRVVDGNEDFFARKVYELKYFLITKRLAIIKNCTGIESLLHLPYGKMVKHGRFDAFYKKHANQ